MILFITLLFNHNSIHDQPPRLPNSWIILITLHDTSSTAMMAVSPLLSDPPELGTRLYPLLILLVLNHPYVLLYIFYLMGILLQSIFTPASPMIDIPSLILIF